MIRTFWDLLQRYSITIPQIQRDYVQGRKTADKARKQLIDDIYIALTEENRPLDLNYIYGQVDANNNFIPVDGQQRLSMLLALYTYIFAKEENDDKLKTLKKFNYDTRETTKRFLENLIDHIGEFFKSSDDVVNEGDAISKFIDDAYWFSNEWNKDPSVVSFKKVLDEIHNKFKQCDCISEKLTSQNCPVTFSYLSIENMGNMNDLYIKMNSRGKQLTEFECIKAEMFKWVDAHSSQQFSDFKEKMDNEWLDMIWNHLGTDAQKKYDETYKDFLVRIVGNRLRAERGERFSVEVESDISKLFSDDVDECEKFIKDIYYTLEFYYNQKPCDSLLNLISDNKIAENRAKLFVLTSFAVNTSEEKWSEFDQWYRIMHNIIVNSDIDREEKLQKVCKSINNMTTESHTRNAVSYFAGLSDEDINTICGNQQGRAPFDIKQIKEEREKCLFIQKDNRWLDLFKKSEEGYFDGQINFVLKLSDITVKSEDQDAEIKKFKDTWGLISKIFNVNKNEGQRLAVDEDLFRRALLTFGDYSFRANSSTNTFFFEGDNFSWRRMLKEETPFNVFQKMFDEIREANNLNSFFENKIDKYEDNSVPFIYNLVKIKGVFSKMGEKRYYCKDGDKKRYLYTAQRCSADYYEAFSYFVYQKLINDFGEQYAKYENGNGDWENKNNRHRPCISKINGNDFVISYNAQEDCFCDANENPYQTDGKNIQTVDEMVSYIYRLSSGN